MIDSLAPSGFCQSAACVCERCCLAGAALQQTTPTAAHQGAARVEGRREHQQA